MNLARWQRRASPPSDPVRAPPSRHSICYRLERMAGSCGQLDGLLANLQGSPAFKDTQSARATPGRVGLTVLHAILKPNSLQRVCTWSVQAFLLRDNHSANTCPFTESGFLP